MAKILINYADQKYYKSQKLNSKTGGEIGCFDKIIEYSRKDIDKKFVKKNAMIINATRGAGYWLWKPYIILKTLENEMKEGDILFYCDSGSYFIDKIDHLLPLLNHQDIVPFVLYGLKERVWSKRDAFILMDADSPEYTDTDQRLATCQLIKKSDFSVKFYQEYLKYATDKRIITDQPNQCSKPNYPEFRDNRHDQTVFSLLTKKYKLNAFRDPSQWGNELIGTDKVPGSNFPQIINLTRNSS